MDFKDFCNESIEPKQTEKINIASNNQNLNNEAEKVIEKYKNYSSDELMNELIKRTNQQKQSGNLTSEKIQKIRSTMESILPPENHDFLEKIFDRLK